MADIVIIEDNAANLELMRYLLDAFGHKVRIANGGDAGLELVRRVIPELIICDVHMPKVDGYEVARILKSDPKLSAIPLVAVTALAMVGDREKGLKAGFDGYLYKPIESQSFVAEVERYLNTDRHGTLPLPPPTPAAQLARDIDHKRARILVIDDSAVNLALLRDMLQPVGYEVWLTRNGVEGYARACESPPDLILSDLHLPDENGFDLFRRIKMNAQLAAVPFVFITSTASGNQDRITAQQLGATRFIVRPIEPAVLFDEIAAVLAERHG